VHLAGTCGEAWGLLKQQNAPIVLCDRDFPGTEWRDVIQMMSSGPDLVYSILVSNVADDYLWNEVIRHGGYDVLSSPFREEELLRAMRLAWSYLSSSARSPAWLEKRVR
jgi:DNA-binding NtrC family response regulator